MLRAGTTTACDVTVPFDGWLETMAQSGMRFYAAPTFASARWGMAAPQTVTWLWNREDAVRQFAAAKQVMKEAEAHECGRLTGIPKISAVSCAAASLCEPPPATRTSVIGTPLRLVVRSAPSRRA